MIRLENVSKIYNENGKNECKALTDVNLNINKNDFIAIVGKSGSGKTTLLNLLALIDNPTSGNVFLSDVNVNELSQNEKAKLRNKQIGIVVQDYALINHFSMLDNILLPTTLTKMSKEDKIKSASALIDSLDLADIPSKKPVKKLSGGQKQRVAIARALINNPDIILADEPTGSIDEEASEQVMDILKRLHKEGKTIIVITHDKDIANQCDRIIELKKGSIV